MVHYLYLINNRRNTLMTLIENTVVIVALGIKLVHFQLNDMQKVCVVDSEPLITFFLHRFIKLDLVNNLINRKILQTSIN